ncbi:MAG: hypothetical protein EP321_03215 [Sphingomonadales bacterium]|nr:MAG: hypothetical protein EP345_09165 [Sphingomonadales bacterium]TNF05509.1 MAG: hypothetical protein EP321_03215 [Sphingomonadales bacterium]
MAFEEGVHEMTCPKCGQRHRVKWSRLPVRDRSTVHCQRCHTVMYNRESVRDYGQATAIDD